MPPYMNFRNIKDRRTDEPEEQLNIEQIALREVWIWRVRYQQLEQRYRLLEKEVARWQRRSAELKRKIVTAFIEAERPC
jgi:hypothetical protein